MELTGKQHRIDAEKKIAEDAFESLRDIAERLFDLFTKGSGTEHTRRRLLNTAQDVVDALTRLELRAGIECEAVEDEAVEIDDEKARRARDLDVPIESLDYTAEQALEQVARGDYDLTWYQAAIIGGRLMRYREALDTLSVRNEYPATVARDALDHEDFSA